MSLTIYDRRATTAQRAAAVAHAHVLHCLAMAERSVIPESRAKYLDDAIEAQRQAAQAHAYARNLTDLC